MHILNAELTGERNSAWKLWTTDNEELFRSPPRDYTEEEMGEIGQYYLIAIPNHDNYLDNNNNSRNYYSSSVLSDRFMVDLYDKNSHLLWELAAIANRNIAIEYPRLAVQEGTCYNWGRSYRELCEHYNISFALHEEISNIRLNQNHGLPADVPISPNLRKPISGVHYKVILEGPDAAVRDLIFIGQDTHTNGSSMWMDLYSNLVSISPFGSANENGGFPLSKETREDKVVYKPTEYGGGRYLGTLRKIIPQRYNGVYKSLPNQILALLQIDESKIYEVVFWTGAEWKGYVGPLALFKMSDHSLKVSWQNKFAPNNPGHTLDTVYVVLRNYKQGNYGPNVIRAGNVVHCKELKQEFVYHKQEIEL